MTDAATSTSVPANWKLPALGGLPVGLGLDRPEARCALLEAVGVDTTPAFVTTRVSSTNAPMPAAAGSVT